MKSARRSYEENKIAQLSEYLASNEPKRAYETLRNTKWKISESEKAKNLETTKELGG